MWKLLCDIVQSRMEWVLHGWSSLSVIPTTKFFVSLRWRLASKLYFTIRESYVGPPHPLSLRLYGGIFTNLCDWWWRIPNGNLFLWSCTDSLECSGLPAMICPDVGVVAGRSPPSCSIPPFCLFNSFCQLITDMKWTLVLVLWYSPQKMDLECGLGCFTCFSQKFSTNLVEPKWLSKWVRTNLPGAAGHLPCTSGGTLRTTTTWRALGSHHSTLDEHGPKLDHFRCRLTVTMGHGSWNFAKVILPS